MHASMYSMTAGAWLESSRRLSVICEVTAAGFTNLSGPRWQLSSYHNRGTQCHWLAIQEDATLDLKPDMFSSDYICGACETHAFARMQTRWLECRACCRNTQGLNVAALETMPGAGPVLASRFSAWSGPYLCNSMQLQLLPPSEPHACCSNQNDMRQEEVGRLTMI